MTSNNERISLTNQYGLSNQKENQESEEEKQNLQEKRDIDAKTIGEKVDATYSNKFIRLNFGDKRIDLLNPQYVNKLEKDIREKDKKIQRLDKRISSLEDKIRRMTSRN